MLAIQAANITLILGGNAIFRDLNWEISERARIGLIGPNGAGKSSLLRLLIGDHTPEPGGRVSRARGVSVGYLAQEPVFEPDDTPWTHAWRGNARWHSVKAELADVEHSLGDPAIYKNEKRLTRALDQQSALLAEYSELGGDTYEQKVYQLLNGLGLPEEDFHKPFRQLSGGQKKLAGLAHLLLNRPSVILLDEPDNHLDLPGKEFLEKLVREYSGAVVIISHDRYLLDACISSIAEIEDGQLTLFNGDYSSFILDKETRLARQEELYRIQQNEISRIEVAIKRYALWGRIYDNPKFSARAHAMQTRLDKMERIERPVLERRRMELKLSGWRGSNKVLEFDSISKSFGTRHLLSGFSETLWHSERVGLIGPNGSGKSVLLRMILGEELPDGGEIRIGPSVKTGYYAQEHETLDLNQTLMDAVRLTAPLTEAAAMAFLIRYLFTYQQATGRIRHLSGGERSRLQLALLVLSGANFLLLDEPTNNLDIASAEVLEQALSEFNGTVLVISHDRYFLDRTVDRLLAIKNGQVIRFPGGYSDYLSKL